MKNDSGNSSTLKERLNGMANSILSVVFTFLLMLILMNVVLVNAVVPSGSMENTIMTGDRIIGVRLGKNYKRGDIIIFRSPEEPDTYLIKRIIGLPGDKVEVTDDGDGFSSVYINGAKLQEDYIREPMRALAEVSLTLPEDGYFVMGDNRNHSNDARFWSRQVIYSDEIIGKAKLRYWPITEFKVF